MFNTILNLIIISYILIKEFNAIKKIVINTVTNINEGFVERRIIKAIIKSKASDKDFAQFQEILEEDKGIEELFEDKIPDDLIINVSFKEAVYLEEEINETYQSEDDTDPITILRNAINSKIGNTKLYEMLLNINMEVSYGDVCI